MLGVEVRLTDNGNDLDMMEDDLDRLQDDLDRMEDSQN